MRYNVDIKQERIKKKLTQAQLGTMIGVSEKSVSKWETGKGEPSYENMEQLCDIFGLSMDKIDTQLSAFRKFQLKLNKYVMFIGVLVNALDISLCISYLSLVIPKITNEQFFIYDLQGLILFRNYYVVSIVLSFIQIGIIIYGIIAAKYKKILFQILILLLPILDFVSLIYCKNCFYDYSYFALIIFLFYIILYVYNLIILNKKERAKVCYHQANSEDL